MRGFPLNMTSRRATLPCLAALAVVLSSCAPKPEGANLDPSFTLLIPADTTTIACVRLDLLQKTDIYKKFFADQMLSFVQEFARQTGVDPRRNLWEVVYVSNGKQGALLGRGMFSDESEPRLDNLTKQGAKRFGYKGFSLVGNDDTAVLLVSQTVVASGQTAFLKQMIDARDKSTGPPPAVAALLKEIPHDMQLWGVYAGGPVELPFALEGNLSNAGKMLSFIQQGSYYFDLRTGLNGVVLADGKNDPDAQQLEGALKGLLGLGRISTPANPPGLQKVWDGFRVTQEARRVKLYVDEPEEMVSQLAGLVKTFRR
jgi:hypothetical protein